MPWRWSVHDSAGAKSPAEPDRTYRYRCPCIRLRLAMAQMNDQPNITFLVRAATPADAGQIARLVFDTVHHVNSRDYAPHQIEAWAPVAPL